MNFVNKLVYRRFSKDEYKQLREILSEETKVLLKRPQYITGNIIMAGLIFYFMVRAMGPKTFEWPKTADIVGIAAGTCAGVLTIWILLRLGKAKTFYARFFMIFWGIWMFLFGLLTIAQPTSGSEWSYLIYAALTLVGWQCSCGSIKEHFVEKIFSNEKNKEDLSATN